MMISDELGLPCSSGIRIFPRRTNATPDDPLVFIGGPELFREGHGESVEISCTFTWDKLECERLAEEWRKAGFEPIIGGPAYDDYGSKFVPGKYLKHGYVITSRGCNNQCWFCQAWRREGSLRELPITDGWNILDNNLLQCQPYHIRNVFDMLRRQSEPIKFTGGLEAKLLDWWHIELLQSIKLEQLFFAYDTPDDYIPLVNAAVMLRHSGIIGRKHRVFCYVLIGYPGDTMPMAEKRLCEVLDLNITPFAMLYRDESNKPGYDWQVFQRRWVRPDIIYQRANHAVE